MKNRSFAGKVTRATGAGSNVVLGTIKVLAQAGRSMVLAAEEAAPATPRMRRALTGSISQLLLLTVVSCSSGSRSSPSTPASDTQQTSSSVETRPKVAPNQTPAFVGQTRIQAVTTQAAYHATAIATGLNHPWGINFLPDGRMMVSERPGSIRIVTRTGSLGLPIRNVPPVRALGEGGLLDIQLDPDFATSRLVFWSYVEPVDNTGVNCVARGRLSDDEASFEDVQVIYRSATPYTGTLHTGSRMLFDSDGRLYVTFGERSDDAIRIQAQHLNSSLGKIIRINKDGSPATGNPFATTPDVRAEVFTYGHRNPQGLAFNPVTHELWESEHGPQAGDEINLIRAGANYGWPIIAYGLEYSSAPVNGTGLTQRDGMEQPVYYWDPVIAPSGMTFYTGSLFPEWQNNLFVAALAGQHIVRLTISNNRILGEERLLADLRARFRHIVQGPDEALYALTDEVEGRIFRIAP